MAGIDLGNAWADNVWEENVWANGVWAGQESYPQGAGGGTRSRSGRNRSRGALFVILFLALWMV